MESVAVEYHDYSDDGCRVFNGTESVQRGTPLVWRSNITMTG